MIFSHIMLHVIILYCVIYQSGFLDWLSQHSGSVTGSVAEGPELQQMTESIEWSPPPSLIQSNPISFYLSWVLACFGERSFHCLWAWPILAWCEWRLAQIICIKQSPVLMCCSRKWYHLNVTACIIKNKWEEQHRSVHDCNHFEDVDLNKLLLFI